MNNAADLVVCLVGGGPRGLSVLERLCAHERKSPSCRSLTVHTVDPSPPGAGRVWRTDQSRVLLMNTVASQITVYTDSSVRIDGPIDPGPSLYEWAQEMAAGPESDAHDPPTLAEARRLGPDSYPTRAFYGCYLRDSFRRIVRKAPAHLSVVVHRSRAVAIADTHGARNGPQSVRLESGAWLHGLSAVVLAQGHVPTRLSPGEERAASLAHLHGLTYLPPANPADVDLSGIAPGQSVLLRGLGLNFFDYMALFTIGRGGNFFRPSAGRLVYRPSGREPLLYATSRRGVPYHARGENQKGPYGRYHARLLTPEFIDGLRAEAGTGGGIGFREQLWPLISTEVRSVYYRTLLCALGREAEAAAFTEEYLAAPGEEARSRLLDTYRIPAADRWDWERIATPYHGRTFADRGDFTAWLLQHLADDVRAARAGNVHGPLKAALDVLRDLRNEVRLAVDHGGLDGLSHRDELDRWYTPLNAFLSIGPPAERIEQMAALIEAGVLVVTGPGATVRIDPHQAAFTATSELVPGDPIRASVLIEARIPEPDLRRTTDPLLLHMLHTGQCTSHRVPGARGAVHETGGLAVTRRPYRLIDAEGQAHPRRFAYGVPTEAVHWVTAAGIRPGVDSVTLGDAEAIARAVLKSGDPMAETASPSPRTAMIGVPV
ncbi:FAD-binding protein [Streptomyces albus subsp. albus]|nr:FAD-binding protein [Streptomyces albus subsp. albus]